MTNKFSNIIPKIKYRFKKAVLQILISVNKLVANSFFKIKGYILGYSYTIGGKKLYPRCRIFFKYTDKHMPIIKTLKVFKHTPSNYMMTSKTNLKKDSSGRACYRNSLSKNMIPKFIYENRFFWYVFAVQVSENPQAYDFKPYMWVFYLAIILIVTIAFLVKKFPQEISFFIEKAFLTMLGYTLARNLICLYCYSILKLRELFEKQSPFLVFGITLPSVAYVFIMFIDYTSTFAQPIFYMSFWLSTGVLFISLDHLGAKICSFLLHYPEHPFSIALSAYFQKREKKNVFLCAGFFTKIGTLTATGQAAIAAGVFGGATTITVAAMNNHYNSKNNDADRTARTAKEDADRTAQANKEAADRTAQAAKDAAAFAYKEKKRAANEKKRTNDYEEAERARQHDRDKWAHEEKMKDKPKSWWPPFSK